MAQPEWGTPPQTSNKAVASLICGVILCFVPSSIAAVILGHLALSDIKRGAGRMAGQGMAVAGLVMGYLGIVFSAIFAVAILLTMRNTLRHDVPGNESAAIETMKTYNRALKAYAAKCPQQGYPTSSGSIGPGQRGLFTRQPGGNEARGGAAGKIGIPLFLQSGHRGQGSRYGFRAGGFTGATRINRHTVFLLG